MTSSVEQAAPRSVERRDFVRDISERIDHTLDCRTAPAGTLRAWVEDEAKRGGTRVWRALERRPSLGVVLVGGLAIAAADAVGVGELAMGIGIGYAAWQVLRKGQSVGEALQEAEQIEHV
jgi:hypothetical protein